MWCCFFNSNIELVKSVQSLILESKIGCVFSFHSGLLLGFQFLGKHYFMFVNFDLHRSVFLYSIDHAYVFSVKHILLNIVKVEKNKIKIGKRFVHVSTHHKTYWQYSLHTGDTKLLNSCTSSRYWYC